MDPGTILLSNGLKISPPPEPDRATYEVARQSAEEAHGPKFRKHVKGLQDLVVVFVGHANKVDAG
jgi:hypothetical protein